MSESRTALLLSSLLLVLAAGCGGDGSSGGGGPTAPQPMIVFTPDGAPGSPSISMRAGGGTTAAVLALDILATDAVDVLTADFTLTYPANLLQFTTFRRGTLLGADASVIVTDVANGSFTALITSAGGTGVSGTGVIVTFELQARASGSGRIDFVDPEAGNSFGLEIADIDWIGGTVQVVQ
jgi:Cohesin domain